MRILGVTEQLLALTSVHVVLMSEAQGPVDVEAMRAAAQRVGRCHPAVASRITIDEGGPALAPSERAVPVITRDGGRRAATEEAACAPPAEGPQLRVAIIEGDDTRFIVLTLPHAVTDGRSLLALHEQLWDAYAAVIAGGEREPPAPHGEDYPAPIEARLAGRHDARELAEHVARRASVVGRLATAALEPSPSWQDAQDFGMRIAGVHLPGDETAALIALAKRSGLSVHGAIAGALLVALRRTIDADGDARTLTCQSTVDMRGAVQPPLSPADLVCAVSSAYSVVEVAPGDDPLKVGRDALAQLRRALADGDVTREVLAMPQLLAEAPLPVSLAISNLGRARLPAAPAGTRVTALRLWASVNAPVPTAVATTVDGALRIDLPYSDACYTDGQMTRLAEHAHGVLGEMLASAPGTP